MAVHRNCKQRVDRVMTKARDLEPLMLRSDTKLLVEEIEDVRAERDEILKRVGDVIDVWDERGVPDKDDDGLKNALEALRDVLPFPRR